MKQIVTYVLAKKGRKSYGGVEINYNKHLNGTDLQPNKYIFVVSTFKGKTRLVSN